MGRWWNISSSFLTSSDFIPQALGIQEKVTTRKVARSKLCLRPFQLSGGMLSRLEERDFGIRRSDVKLIKSTEMQEVTVEVERK